MRAIAIGTLAFGLALAGPTADDALDAAARSALVERVGALVSAHYVDAAVGAACPARLQERQAAGDFGGASEAEALARLVTETLRAASGDLHLQVRVRAPGENDGQPDPRPDAGPDAEPGSARVRFGFAGVERLQGNVGYLDLRGFSGEPEAIAVAENAMGRLAGADALVIDLRRNGGGNPRMVRFLCSYLFAGPVHLVSIHWREDDRVEAYWTLPDVPGARLADVPVFLVTSADTFSAAEGFCDILQSRGRATIVGARTRGGANPGREFVVDERFAIAIPTGRAVNPVTGTNWEGVGITPDVEADGAAALDGAVALAIEAARRRRTEDLASDRDRPPATVVPVPSAEDRAAAAGWHEGDWMRQHEDINAIGRTRDVGIVFLGDSITQSWGGAGRRVAVAAPGVWAEHFGDRAANAGISGDRTQHALWRIDHGNLDAVDPRFVVLMIGTNNIGHDAPEDIAAGIEAIVERIAAKKPRATILLCAIVRGGTADDPFRGYADRVNELIRPLDDRAGVRFVELAAAFYAPGGGVGPGLMREDFVHFAPAGYRAWADAVLRAMEAGE